MRFILECPSDFQVPAIENILQCAMDEHCLGIECCVGLNFKLTTLSVKAWLFLDPCEFTFVVGFEKMSFNISLFNYKWGNVEEIQISNFLAIR